MIMNEHTERFSGTSTVLFLSLDDLLSCTHMFYALLQIVQFQHLKMYMFNPLILPFKINPVTFDLAPSHRINIMSIQYSPLPSFSSEADIISQGGYKKS